MSESDYELWADEDEPAQPVAFAGQLNMLDAVEANTDREKVEELSHQWIGLPAFREETKPSRLVIAFDTDSDRRAFMDQLGLETVVKGTRGTLSVRFPDRGKEDLSSVRFVVEATS